MRGSFLRLRETSGTLGAGDGRYGASMRWKFILAVPAAVLIAAGVALVLPDHAPPARVWALETPDADGVPMPVRIALLPGGDALDEFDLTAGCGGGGMGGNITHFLTLRRGAASHLRDLVRDPPPPTLGYRRRRHVVTNAEGEWRELVVKNPDGSDPPVPGGEALAGAWEHVSGDGHTWGLALRADGTLDVTDGVTHGVTLSEGQGDWTRTGTTLVLALDLAPDGVWPTGSDHVEDDATCEIADGGASYAGTDRSGRAVSGRRAPTR